MPTSSLRALAVPRRVDLLVAAGLLGWALPDVPWWWRPPGHGAATPVVLGYLALALGQSIPFLWRRRWPVVVLSISTAVLLARLTLRADPISAFAALLVAAYGLGAYGRHTRRFARWLGGASLVAAAALALDGGGVGNRALGLPWALLGAAFVVGDAASARRAETAAAVEAAHLAERTRIARELHDVLAHQLSAIAVRSGAARLAAAGSRPERPAGEAERASVEALAAVEQLSREALAELGHLLGALRREPDDDLRHPAPSLRSLDALLASTRDAGVPVDLEVDGPVRPLSPGVELAAYRIIQEALTNVAKHAPAAPTRVVLEYRDDRLGVSVVNGPPPLGRPRDDAGPGRGVRGMRERAALHSGRLEVIPRPDGGFVVSGVLPCGDDGPGAGEAPA
jgi:signal transduction histidine kinase